MYACLVVTNTTRVIDNIKRRVIKINLKQKQWLVENDYELKDSDYFYIRKLLWIKFLIAVNAEGFGAIQPK